MEYGNGNTNSISQDDEIYPFGSGWEPELTDQLDLGKIVAPLEFGKSGYQISGTPKLLNFRATTFEERSQQSQCDAKLMYPVLGTVFLGSEIIQVEGGGTQLSHVLDASAKIDYLIQTPSKKVFGIGMRMTMGRWDTLTMSVSQYRCLSQHWINGTNCSGILVPAYLVQGYVDRDRSGNRILRSAAVVSSSKFFPWAKYNPGQLRYSRCDGKQFYSWTFEMLVNSGIDDAVFPILPL